VNIKDIMPAASRWNHRAAKPPRRKTKEYSPLIYADER
jgi:hypothetical protein